MDNEKCFEAYCSQEKYSLDKVKDCAEENLGFVQGLEISYLEEKIEQKDWNAEWEKDYSSVRFSDFCVVRPEFNPKQEGVKYDIIINPKMSFGTAHHQTTSLIIDFISMMVVFLCCLYYIILCNYVLFKTIKYNLV